MNISLWNGASSDFSLSWTEQHSIVSWTAPMFRLLDILNQQGTVVVAAAGNGGWDIRGNFPAGPRLPQIISVGALEDIDSSTANPPLDLTRAIFARTGTGEPLSVSSAKNIVSYASNWGVGSDTVDIWAPGQNMFAFGTNTSDIEQTTGKVRLPARVLFWNGTSAASPLISGIVALIKSANNPNYRSKDQIISLLQNTAQDKTYVDTQLRSHPFKSGNSSDACDNAGIHCGTLQTNELHIQAVDAKSAVATAFGSEKIAKSFEGTLKIAGNNFIFDAKLPTEGLKFLAWGDNLDRNLIGEIHVEDTTVTPTQFVKLGNLVNTTTPVGTFQIDGWLDNGILRMARIRKIQGASIPPPSDKKWVLEVSNVNDHVVVTVNDEVVTDLRLNTPGVEPKVSIDISNKLLPTNNKVRFRVFNESNEPGKEGSSWGFVLKGGLYTYYRDIRGNAINRSTAQRFGARRNDPSLGLVYDQTITINKNGSSPGSGPFTFTSFGVSDLMQVSVALQPPGSEVSLVDITANDFFVEKSLESFFSQTPSPLVIGRLRTSSLSHPLFSDPLNNKNTITWTAQITRGGTLIYFDRDGERENLDVNPSGAFFNQRFPCCGSDIVETLEASLSILGP